MTEYPVADLDALYAQHLEHWQARLGAILESSGFSALLLYSGYAPYTFRDDQQYAFRAHAPFKLWAPLSDVPDCFVYLEPGRKQLLVFHQPRDYWHKPATLPQGYWTRHFDIVTAASRERARDCLPRDLSRVAYVGDLFAELAGWSLGALNPERVLQPLDYHRAVKTPYELACLRQANRIGTRGHIAAARAFGAGASEFEIQLEYLRACGLREQELPYNNIIALNDNAAVLHYQLLERGLPGPRHSLLIDAGAEFAGYASDITRTYSFENADFAVLIDKMDDLQQSLCSSVHAGVDWRDVHLSAHRMVGELLHEAGVILCEADEAVDTGITSLFLPHGLGHLLGLQVHDTGGLMRAPDGGEIPRPTGHPNLRLTRILEPGFVVTMEPGIYFIDQLLEEARADSRGRRLDWSRIEDLRRFGGIRIEDDLAVTENGYENLTRDAFRER